jgi:predicted DNA-binding transcriptional regulator AlpA
MELVGVTEIAALWGISRQRADVLTRRPTFPAPIALLGGGHRRVWDWADVEAWGATHRPLTP